jgi:tetratricopeptide (TPR) repeat protein
MHNNIRHLWVALLAIIIWTGFSNLSLCAQSAELDSLWVVGHDMEQHDTSRLDALIKYASHAYLKSSPDSAVLLVEVALAEAIAKDLPKQQARAYTVKGAAAFNKGEFKNAIGFHNMCLKIYLEIDYPKGIGSCYNNLANCYMRLGDPAKAMRYYEAALEIWVGTGDKSSAAATLHNLGSIHMNYGDNARAIELFTQSLLIREELGDEDGIAVVENNIGILYQSLEDPTSALKHFRASLAIRDRLSERRGQASTMIGIGGVYVSMHKMDSALYYFQSALRINREAADVDNMAQTQVNIAQVYQLQERHAEAEIYCDSALQNYTRTENAEGLCMVRNSLGEIKMDLQQYPAAITEINKSLEIAQAIQSVPAMRDAANNLYKAYKAMGQNGKALEMHEMYVVMRDSVQSEENERSIIRQELKYEFEKANLMRQQEQRAAEQKAKEIAMRRDRLQYSLISGIVIFLLIGMVILGLLRVPQKIAFATVFLALLVVFEFILVLIDPYTEPIAQGQPAFKFLINLGLALLLTPVHHVLEQFVHRRLIRFPRQAGSVSTEHHG